MSAHINQECLLDAQGAVDQFDRLPPFISRKYNFDNLQLAQLADKNSEKRAYHYDHNYVQRVFHSSLFFSGALSLGIFVVKSVLAPIQSWYSREAPAISMKIVSGTA